MFKLKNNINQKKNEILIVEILFYIFPLSFLIGNLAISINTLLFIIVSLVFIKKNQINQSGFYLYFFYIFLSLLQFNIYILDSLILNFKTFH